MTDFCSFEELGEQGESIFEILALEYEMSSNKKLKTSHHFSDPLEYLLDSSDTESLQTEELSLVETVLEFPKVMESDLKPLLTDFEELFKLYETTTVAVEEDPFGFTPWEDKEWPLASDSWWAPSQNNLSAESLLFGW